MTPWPFDLYKIDLDDWIDTFVEDWLVPNLGDVFDALKWPVDKILTFINENIFLWLHPFAILALFLIAAWWVRSFKLAVISVAAMTLVGFLGYWDDTMTTLAVIFTSVVFCAAAGIPLGIIAARSDRFEAILRPVLDAMQTVPPFVYLVPIVMLFGIGLVPGTIATIIFALPPVIRLTNLGIRQVDAELIEAAYAFGSTSWQVLREVQIPLALRTIMAGLNQTLMLALSMVVIAALIGAGGLGRPIVQALGNLWIGQGFVAGLAIVILAIVLDRITQGLGEPKAPGEMTVLQKYARVLISWELPNKSKPESKE